MFLKTPTCKDNPCGSNWWFKPWRICFSHFFLCLRQQRRCRSQRLYPNPPGDSVHSNSLGFGLNTLNTPMFGSNEDGVQEDGIDFFQGFRHGGDGVWPSGFMLILLGLWWVVPPSCHLRSSSPKTSVGQRMQRNSLNGWRWELNMLALIGLPKWHDAGLGWGWKKNLHFTQVYICIDYTFIHIYDQIHVGIFANMYIWRHAGMAIMIVVSFCMLTMCRWNSPSDCAEPSGLHDAILAQGPTTACAAPPMWSVNVWPWRLMGTSPWKGSHSEALVMGKIPVLLNTDINDASSVHNMNIIEYWLTSFCHEVFLPLAASRPWDNFSSITCLFSLKKPLPAGPLRLLRPVYYFHDRPKWQSFSRVEFCRICRST